MGTISVEKSERLSEMLKRRGVPHEVLNARHHDKEAAIIADAGQKGAVTIATNMAGRGTDIKLGEGVVEAGGLFVLGTERHEARRVDNQLRGRSGRQGDPGVSQFIISLDDDLLRIFGGERIHRLMDRLGLEESVPIEHSLISRSVESAQKKVEEQNFQIRKRVLEYDDVMNKQREVIYGQRQRILGGDDLREDVLSIIERILRDQVALFTGASRFSEEWDLEEMLTTLRNFYPTTLTVEKLGDPTDSGRRDAGRHGRRRRRRCLRGQGGALRGRGHERDGRLGAASHHRLQVARAPLRDGLPARGHRPAGSGPARPADRVQERGLPALPGDDGVHPDGLRALRLSTWRSSRRSSRRPLRPAHSNYSGGGDTGLQQNFAGTAAAARRSGVADSSGEAYDAAQAAAKNVVAPRTVSNVVGRNDPCPCGSGKKYKKCCGA